MQIAENIGSILSCGAKPVHSDLRTVGDDEDVVEPDIDVGSYDDIVEDKEYNKINLGKVETKIPVFRGFLIEQLIGRQ